MLERFDFSDAYNNYINSIFSALSDIELSKMPILVTKTEGTKIYIENGDDIKELGLNEHTTIIENKRDDVKMMNLLSLREEIYRKAYESITIKKKNILESIQQSPSTFSISTTNIAQSYIEIIRQMKKDPNYVVMTSPKTLEKLIHGILTGHNIRMKIRKYLAENENVQVKDP